MSSAFENGMSNTAAENYTQRYPVTDDAPIGKIRVQCFACSESFVCDHDDVFGFDDDTPIYMCGTCQRQRVLQHGGL